jgi:signal transduction histidine kinase
VIIGYFWIETLYSEYNREYSIIKNEYISSQKSIIKKEVNSIIQYIYIQKNSINDRIKDDIAEKTDKLYNFYKDISKSLSHLSKKEYKQVINKTLQSVINQNENYHIVNGKDIIKYKNKTIDKDILDAEKLFLQTNTKGFVVVNKIVNNRPEIYISYVKRLKESTYISYGYFFSYMESIVKKEIVKKINSMKFGEDSYFFAFDTKGNVIANPAQPQLVGTNVYNLTTGNNVKVVQEEIRVANSNTFGGFIEYDWYKPSTKKETKKIAFIRKVEDWNWIVGTGVYIDTIEKRLKDKEEYLNIEINRDIEKIFIVLLISTLIAFAILSYLSTRLKNSFDTLGDFFKKASKKYVKIDVDKIFFEEFKALGESINVMVEKKLQDEDRLKDINKELGIRVEREIKSRREKELLLIQQSKMASMGEMIGNIAHQWRQPLSELSTIFMNINFKYRKNNLSSEYIEQKILQSEQIIEYMSNTIDDFRNFYSINKNKEKFSLLEACEETINILKSILKYHDINYVMKIDKEIYIDGYKSEFEQALLNIISNSKDILVQNSVLDANIKIYSKIEYDSVVLVIEDNGGGIKTEPIDKIFEPYFTTKHQSKGTGIGLYMTKMIIENNHLALLRAYNINNGARFEIIFEKNYIIDSEKTD